MIFFKILVRLFPENFRERYGEEMAEMFADIRRERGRWGALWFYPVAARDIVLEATRTRLRTPKTEKNNVWQFVHDLKSDLIFALRGLFKNSGFATVAIVTIAVGIGANAAVFSVVNGVLVKPLPYPESERLVMIFNRWTNLGVHRNAQNPGDFFDYRERTDAFESIEAIGSAYNQTLTGLGTSARVTTTSATDGLFDLLGARPALGRLFEEQDDHTRAVISHGFWQDFFGGDPDAVGRTFELNGQATVVIGVLENSFRLHVPAHMAWPQNISVWVPIRQFLGNAGNYDRTAHWMTTVARLKEGVTLATAQNQMDRVAAWQRENFAVRRDRAAEIEVVGMHAEIVSATRPTILALFGAVALVLLIASANVANLLIARSQSRKSEMAVRAALGGSRMRIFRQVMTESAVVASLGGLVGIGLTYIGVRFISAFVPADMPFVGNLHVDGSVLIFLLTVSAATVFLFGLAPAITASRANVGELMDSRGAGASGLQRKGAGGAIVVGEIALSVVLLIGGGLLVRSYLQVGKVNVGYEPDNILTFVAGEPPSLYQGTNAEKKEKKQAYLEMVKARILTIPGVLSVGTIWPTPLSGASDGSSTYTDNELAGDEQTQNASSQLITPGYFATMGIPVLEGRTLGLNDGGDKLVVDRNMAEKMWPGENPIGKRLKIGWWSGPVWGDVVGVVENVRTSSVTADDAETVYRKAVEYAYSPSTFVVRTEGDPAAMADIVRSTVQSIDVAAAIEQMRPLSAYVDEQMAPLRFVMTLITVFAFLATLLAAIGLYAVLSFVVGARKREMGIRIACGARPEQIVRLVLKQGVLVALLGTGAGAVLAIGLIRFLQSYLYGLQPSDPITMGVVVVLVGTVTVLATLSPAIRASRFDPVTSLKME